MGIQSATGGNLTLSAYLRLLPNNQSMAAHNSHLTRGVNLAHIGAAHFAAI